MAASRGAEGAAARHDAVLAPVLAGGQQMLVPQTARDLSRTVAQARRYAAFQLLTPLAFLANVAFLLLALHGFIGNGSLRYYVTSVYWTKLTPSWWTFLALPGAWAVDAVAIVWFVLPWPRTEQLFRRRWARTVIPSVTAAFLCEIGWLFALLYDLAWLSLVFSFLAGIALFAGWFVSIRMTERRSDDELEFAYDDDSDPDFEADADDFFAASDHRRLRDDDAAAADSDNDHHHVGGGGGGEAALSAAAEVLSTAEVLSALAVNHDGAEGGGGGAGDDAMSDSGNSLRRPSSSQGTMMTAGSVGDLSDDHSSVSMTGFMAAKQSANRRVAFERALWRRAWPLARTPCAVHFGVALLRIVLNMQIVAVNQFVIIPQSLVYQAIVITGLTFFTLCVLAVAAWQRDALVPLICGLGLASVAFGPRSCFDASTCLDQDSVLISLTTASLAGVLCLELFVIVALRVFRRRDSHK